MLGLGLGMTFQSGSSVVRYPALSDYADSTDEQTLSGTIKRHNSFARLRIQTSGTSLRAGYWGNFPFNSHFTIVVNGTIDQTVILTGDGTPRTVDITLPAGANKLVDIWEGPQYGFYEPNIQAGGVVTSLQMLDSGFTMVAPSAPSRRTVIYGDSIANGYPVVVQQAYAGLLRLGGNVGGVTVYGSGGRSIDTDRIHQTLSVVATKLSDALADVQGGGRQDLLVVIGTNDWGQATDGGASNFQTSVATLADAVHALRPNAKVHLVSPIIRSGEATPNAQGNTLADYRTAMSNVASTRASWCVYWDASAVLTLADLADGVHPTPTGYQKLTTYFEGTVLI